MRSRAILDAWATKRLGRRSPCEQGSRGRSGSLRGRRCGAGAGTWAGDRLVSKGRAAVPRSPWRRLTRGTVMKPILVNARGAGAAAARSPLRCRGSPTPLRGSWVVMAPWQTPRHWQSHCTGPLSIIHGTISVQKSLEAAEFRLPCRAAQRSPLTLASPLWVVLPRLARPALTGPFESRLGLRRLG